MLNAFRRLLAAISNSEKLLQAGTLDSKNKKHARHFFDGQQRTVNQHLSLVKSPLIKVESPLRRTPLLIHYVYWLDSYASTDIYCI